MILSWPNHPLTLEDWEALPEDSAIRLELAEGMLVICPRPPALHPGVEVVISSEPLTIRAPDVIVVPTELYDANPTRCTAADVLLAVEILSTGTHRADRVLKFSEYEEAGIPQYWILDLDDPTSLFAHVLLDGSYELSGEHAGVVTLDVGSRPVEIDLPALTRR